MTFTIPQSVRLEIGEIVDALASPDSDALPGAQKDRLADLLERTVASWTAPLPLAVLPEETAPKDGRMIWVLVDYANGDHPLNDARFSWSIGFNRLRDTGEDEWQFAGWCWQHDHFTEGKGKVIGWCSAPLPDPPTDDFTPDRAAKHGALEQAFERDAMRQGLSDGRFGRQRNPGDFEGQAKANYTAAFEQGRADREREPDRWTSAAEQRP